MKLFNHQKEAVEAWWVNGGQGILSMATGTGKTYTALGCLERVLGKTSSIVAVITFPWNHLLLQWEKALGEFNFHWDSLIAVSQEKDWKKTLRETVIDIELGRKKKIAILISHDSFSSEFFRKQIKEVSTAAPCIVVADEVHGLGAPQRKKGLLDFYSYRLGLSATPERYFDDKGTRYLLDYFGGVVFEFPLKKAINTINPITNETYLTPYDYFLRFVPLEENEVEEYLKLTSQIVRHINRAQKDYEVKERLEQLLFRRAKIIKGAKNKLKVLEEIVTEIGLKNLEHTLVYCDEELLNNVISFFNEKGVISHRFTMEEGIIPQKRFGGLSERDFYLEKFGKGIYQVLVAIKCLDEGVDVPPARRAILMASSGNPREFIQRIGRILRRYPGKNRAQVYDMVAYVPRELLSDDMSKIEKSVLEREFKRCEEIAACAENWLEVTNELFSKRREML
ncbi:MAG: DEAD/DEAH box helicase family protein [Atribacterales bacterium]